MWKKDQLSADLRELGIREGKSVLIHASLRAVGEIEGGAETLVEAFRETLGESGTLLVPSFTIQRRDPVLREELSVSTEKTETLRREIPAFERNATPCDATEMGILAETIRLQKDSFRSDHPGFSFAAIGQLAEALTANAPFHYPFGSGSPLARLHQHNGIVLLAGVGQQANISLRLAEIWANVPYIHRTRLIKTDPISWKSMKGSPECCAGFAKIELALRQARLLQTGYLGNAQCLVMRQQELISMAISVLRGAPDSLLCNDPDCPYCASASKISSPSTYLEGQSI